MYLSYQANNINLIPFIFLANTKLTHVSCASCCFTVTAADVKWLISQQLVRLKESYLIVPMSASNVP